MISMDHHYQTLLEVRSIKRSSHNKLFRFPHRDYLWNYIYRISLNVQNIGKVTSQGLVGQHGGAFLVFHTGTFLKGKQLS